MADKIREKFYPLRNDEWLEIAKKLTHSELLILYHLRTLEPFGDKLTESSTKDVAEATGISQRSVQRALIKLAEMELIDLQIQKFAFRLRSKSQATETTDSDSAVAMTTTVSRKRQPCRVNDSRVAQTSPLSDSTSETPTVRDLHISKTLKTYSDLKDSLSDKTRESFEKFCFRKIEESSFKIASPQSWLKKHYLEYWEEFSRKHPEAAGVEKSSATAEPDEFMTAEYLQKIYSTDWKNAADHFGIEYQE